MSDICRTCGTSLAEGEHGIITASDENSVTFSCRFPRESALPRTVHYMTSDAMMPEYWYRPEPLSPSDTMRAHLDTFRAPSKGEGQ